MVSAPPSDLTTLDDDALRAACAQRPWERAIARVVGWGAIASLLGAYADVGRPICLVGLASFGLAALWVARRHDAPRAELSRRYGGASLASYVEVERGALLAAAPPATSLLLLAVGLPTGDHRWVRVHLWDAPTPRARIEVRTMQGKAPIERAALFRGDADLPAELVADLIALRDEARLVGLGHVPEEVRDGLRCQVTMLDRGGVPAVTGSCNLAGLTAATRAIPTARLCLTLMDASTLVAAPPGWGACDARGDITIGALAGPR